MTSDLTTIPKKAFEKKWKNWHRFYSARYRLDMYIGSAEIKFELLHNDKSYGFAKAEFEHLV